MKKPTAVDQAFILKWMKEEGIECVGLLEEADMQCVKFEKDGIVDGILTEDSDMFGLGAENLYCKMSKKKNGEYQVKHLNRGHFFHPSNPYKSQLNRHQHNLLDAALLLGNDYVPRIKGNGAVAVVLGLEEKNLTAPLQSRTRLQDRLDKLAATENKKEWLLKYGTNGKSAMPEEIQNIYWKARAYMQYAPVLQYCHESGQVMIVPLNPLPNQDADFAEVLDQQWIAHMMADQDQLIRIYNCEILPLERKALDTYQLPSTLTGEANDIALFEELNFDAVPLEIQPDLCIINWLRARGCNANLFSSRD